MAKGRGTTRAAPRFLKEQPLFFYTTDSATVAGVTQGKGAWTCCLTRGGRAGRLRGTRRSRIGPVADWAGQLSYERRELLRA